MKKIIVLFAASTLFVACNNSLSEATTFENQTINIDSANISVDINYPLAINKRNNAVADSINKYITHLLDQLPQAADSSIFPLQKNMSWEAQTGEKVIQISTETYWFTGGAHGMKNLSSVLFNADNGQRISPLNIIKDTAVLLNLLETQLKADSIPVFDFIKKLPMPQNIVFNNADITAIYNQYEIAPYAYGVIKINIPYQKLGTSLDTTMLLPATIKTIQCKPKE